MYTKKQLDKIRKKLPKGGYGMISVKLGDITPEYVQTIFCDPKRAEKKLHVIDTALNVIQEHNERIAAQKKRARGILK